MVPWVGVPWSEDYPVSLTRLDGATPYKANVLVGAIPTDSRWVCSS